ncbi:hypothetical protein PAXRUDRAFT_823049 [Paxillus rubicundulus Ve08.2h10]|uniref:Uncharacterized protein n=1 Tax=Paxillus rubicundulus Ve08.2h10 TaxID=930991 RepID=A0A0D0DKU9_9AGAM|nr:hypothetical protein PAXRUDRAFT_823049 [Paxillus rubicundulus Ve08.2h10]
MASRVGRVLLCRMWTTQVTLEDVDQMKGSLAAWPLPGKWTSLGLNQGRVIEVG